MDAAGRLDAGALARLRFFESLGCDVLEQLVHETRVFSLRAGDYLFRRGEPARELFVVWAGRLRVLVEGEEGQRVVREVGPGGALGELALLTGSARSASVQAVRDSELLVLDAAAFERLLSDPGFSRSLVGELAQQLQASGGLDSPTSRPRVFSVVPLRPGCDAVRLAAVLERELARWGSVATLHGDENGDGYGAALARAEAANDAVVLVSAGEDSEWDAFCRRQADRTLLLADSDTPFMKNPGGSDLVLIAPMPSGATAQWLERAGPARHHLVYEAAYDVGARRVARRVAGRSLGVVLSGGGARGFAHVGVLAALAEAGYEIDRLGGCSIGAFIGAMAALGLDHDQIRERCRDELVNRTPFNDWTVPRVGLIRGRKATRMLERLFGELRMEELPRPLFTVSADLISSRTVVHNRGPIVDAVAASMSIPGLAPPFFRGGRLLVDGGVLNNLPVDLMYATLEGPVIAVDVVRRLELEREDEAPQLPSIMETMTRATVLGSVERAERNRRLASLVISPDVHDIGLREFSALDRAIAAGHAAAQAALASEAARGRALGQ